MGVKSVAKLEREVRELNDRFPAGTQVAYWRGNREGEGKQGLIEHPFEVLGGHTVVGWITGCSGCIAATHIEAVRLGELETANAANPTA